MAAKNGISVKKEYKSKLLGVFTLLGISYKKANIISNSHVTYLISTTHQQQIFLAGFHFCKVTGHCPQIF